MMGELEKTLWKSEDGEVEVQVYTRNGVAYVGLCDGEYNYIEIDYDDANRVADAIRDAVAEARAWLMARKETK
jgi:hypothetical protein